MNLRALRNTSQSKSRLWMPVFLALIGLALSGCLQGPSAGVADLGVPDRDLAPCEGLRAIRGSCTLSNITLSLPAYEGDLAVEWTLEPTGPGSCTVGAIHHGVRQEWGLTDATLVALGSGGYGWWASDYQSSAHLQTDAIDTRGLTSPQGDWIRAHGTTVNAAGTNVTFLMVARALAPDPQGNPYGGHNSTTLYAACDSPFRFESFQASTDFLFFNEYSMNEGTSAGAQGQAVAVSAGSQIRSISNHTRLVLMGGSLGQVAVTTPQGTTSQAAAENLFDVGGPGDYRVEVSMVGSAGPFWGAVVPLAEDTAIGLFAKDTK